MQAYLAYGISRNNLKRMTLLQRVRKIDAPSLNACAPHVVLCVSIYLYIYYLYVYTEDAF